MELVVTIIKSSVLEEVYKLTGYTGSKHDDIDKLSSTEDDALLLTSFYKEGTSSLSDEVSRFGSMTAESDSDSTFKFELPSSWNDKFTSSLQKSMAQYVVSYVCAKWFNLMMKDESKYYDGICNGLSASITKYLCERKRPSRV